MPSEFIVVIFPEKRTVLAEGAIVGSTGELIGLGAGTYTFSLDGAQDYDPRRQRLLVGGTSAVDPLKITFTQRAPGATGPNSTPPFFAPRPSA
jgi:hypothetical protein